MNVLPCNSDGSVAGESFEIESTNLVEAVFELGLPVIVQAKYFTLVGDGTKFYLLSNINS